MAKKKKLKTKRIAILISSIIVIIIISFSLINKKDNVEINSQEIKEQQEEQKNISKLEDMNERNRMEYYLSVFINYLENEDYQSAYDLLYDEFKQTYFPTINDFEEYAKKTFPRMMNIQHDNIERNGDVYVLWINVSDLVNGGPNDKKEMNVVIKENDFNDFVISFSIV